MARSKRVGWLVVCGVAVGLAGCGSGDETGAPSQVLVTSRPAGATRPAPETRKAAAVPAGEAGEPASHFETIPSDEPVKVREGDRTLYKKKDGLMWEDLREGQGPTPKIGQTVSVYYTLTHLNGGKIESNVGQSPFTFRLGQKNTVIQGWHEGLLTMKKGGKRRLTIPAPLAYGERGSLPKIAPNETLVFEVELADITGTPARIKQPVSAPELGPAMPAGGAASAPASDPASGPTRAPAATATSQPEE